MTPSLTSLTALLVALTRADDDVLAIEAAPDGFDAACRLARLRPRKASRDEAFDAIGEHTRVLCASASDPELLEALVEFGPSVLAFGSAPRGFEPLAEGLSLHLAAGASFDREGFLQTTCALAGVTG